MGLVDDLDIMERIDEGFTPSRVALTTNYRKTAPPTDRRDLVGAHGVTTAALEQWVHDAQKRDPYALRQFWQAIDNPYSVAVLRLAEMATDVPIDDILTELIERAGIGDLRRH